MFVKLTMLEGHPHYVNTDHIVSVAGDEEEGWEVTLAFPAAAEVAAMDGTVEPMTIRLSREEATPLIRWLEASHVGRLV